MTSVSGEIANPQSSYLVLLHHDKTLDTVLLDGNNHFFYQFDDKLPSGLFKIAHNYGDYDETQMFYMEPGDAVRLRLNTRDFDNSIMYSGTQAEANNFLTHLFLEFRNENKLVLSHYYRLTPQQFVHKIDSIHHRRVTELDSLYKSDAVSEGFYELGKQVIAYTNYDWRERYYFLISKYLPHLKVDLPSDFLAYRKQADYNLKSLQTYYLYQYFIRDYLKNESVLKCEKIRKGADCYDLNSRANLIARIKLADSLFHLKSLRTRFLTQFGSELIMESQTEAEVDEVTRFLDSITFEGLSNRQLQRLASVQKRQFISNISNLNLETPEGKRLNIMKVLTKPTLIYYWSIYYKSLHINSHNEIARLRLRYPEVNFIGINIDNEDKNLWKSSLVYFDYNHNRDEYQLVCPPELADFYTNYLNRLFLVNTDGQIINGKIRLTDAHLEEEILEVLNR